MHTFDQSTPTSYTPSLGDTSPLQLHRPTPPDTDEVSRPRTLWRLRPSQCVTPHPADAYVSNAANGIHSPPSLVYERSPYTCVPLPPATDEYITLYPMLSATSGWIRFDVLLLGSAHGWEGHLNWVNELATKPSLRSMSIRSNLLPWTFTVMASKAVKVGDILSELHKYLSFSVTEEEHRFYSSQSTATGSIIARVEYHRGMKRSDFLMGRSWWVGLTKSAEGPETWDLELALEAPGVSAGALGR